MVVSDKTCNFAPAFENKRAFSSVGLEHLPYKQRVGGSNPSTPTNRFSNQKHGWFPEWPNGADCKSAASSFGGSNPSPPTSTRDCFAAVSFFILFFCPLLLFPSFILFILHPIYWVSSGVLAKRCSGSPDKPGGLSIQLCKSEKKEFYIRYSSLIPQHYYQLNFLST